MSGTDTGFAILAFFVVIGPLIFFHELGHYLTAKLHNIKVEEFGIGYPPRMLTLFEYQGTIFTLNWIPLGGFVRPSGEDNPDVPGGLASASRWARFSVLSAGALANFVLAFLLLWVMFMIGAPVDSGAQIETVVPDSPAAEAGLEPGDIILAIDDSQIEQSADLRDQIYDNLGQPIIMLVERGSETLELNLTPRSTWPEGEGPTGIVFAPISEMQQYGPLTAAGRTFEEFGALGRAFVQLPVMVIQQEIPLRFLRPLSPVGISQLGGETINVSLERNIWWPIIQLTAYISFALGATNLLPIPALDGGRILFVLIEAVRGRRIDPQREMAFHLIGFAVLLTAMLLFVYLDIVDPLFEPGMINP